MTQKITGEAPFQVLATNFSISPSLQNYILQISADGINYSDLFTVSAGQTKMVTNVANGSFYRMKNNNSEVTINWRTQCNDGQGGGGGSYVLPPATEQTLGGVKVGSGLTVQADGTLSANGGSADYATSAGTASVSNSTKLLEGASAPPQSANTGDVIAIAATPTRGLRSARTLGIYQYDGTNWNKIEGEGSSAYVVELSTNEPEDFTSEDKDTLNAFFAAVEADPSIAKDAYVQIGSEFYRCSWAEYDSGNGNFNFVLVYSDLIDEIDLQFGDGEYSDGSHSEWNGEDNTHLKPATELPENPVEGEIVVTSEETEVDYKPESPNGETVYGGNLGDFMGAVRDSGNNKLWVKIDDDTPEGVELGYFHTENDVIDYYDYQGDTDYLFDDLAVGEWVDANTIYLWKEGKNLYFYIKIDGEDVYFPDTQSSMVFDTILSENLVNQYDNGEWKVFPQALYGRADFPKLAAFGDVVGLGKYIDREATETDIFSSATVTMVNGRAAFKMYNPNYGGYCRDYTFGYENGAPFGAWGADGNVINGPWNDQGVEFSISGDDITFTTQSPENTEEALLMWGFEPNCNDRIVVKELGVYQYDGEDWIEIGSGGTYTLPAATEQTLGGIKVGNGLTVQADGTLSAEGGESDFIHLDTLSGTGETGKTYEFEGRIMQWVEGSGSTAEWLSNIANIDNAEGTGLIYSTIPDGQKLFEYKYSYGGEWRYVIYSGGTLYCTETGGTVVASASTGEEFIFQTQSQSNYQIKGYFENGHIGFAKIGYVSVQNVWDGNAANSHYELIDKYNYPYTNVQSNGVDTGIVKWNKYGQVVKKQGDISTKAIQFNTNASQYSSTGKITFYTDGTNNGPDRIFVPTTGGQTGQTLVSAGDNSAPVWETRIKVVKITSDAYDALVQAGTTDPNTLYAIVDE